MKNSIFLSRCRPLRLLISVVAVVATINCRWVPSAAAADCDAITADYDAALPAAQACDPAAPDACAGSRARSLRDVCKCQVAVNPNATAELDRLAAAFQGQACPYHRPVCNLACAVPLHSCTAGNNATPRCGVP